MAEQFLDCPDVITGLQQMCRKGMAQRMRCGWLGQLRIAHRLLHRALHPLLVQVVAARLAGTRINRQISGRENILPAPFAPGSRIFLVQRKRQIHFAETLRQIFFV
ncbi:MAG: hypothetical protein A3H99_05945 [Gallionellales bacterium RIFCSPLOWO2_02_FULL_59_110]|nr:MAG: hypothetical protein A3H99_05945 [Gallionellales bacterium RIFCSPLOWO2_02_FULL_59_110]